VRLVGGSHNAGRVEVYYQRKWWIVCDDYWDINDARVVCKQLGFPDAEIALENSYFGSGIGQILLDDVKCRGDEPSLFLCKHSGVENHNCARSEIAGVRCNGTRFTGENE
jgi:hypothetical protein